MIEEVGKATVVRTLISQDWDEPLSVKFGLIKPDDAENNVMPVVTMTIDGYEVLLNAMESLTLATALLEKMHNYATYSMLSDDICSDCASKEVAKRDVVPVANPLEDFDQYWNGKRGGCDD